MRQAKVTYAKTVRPGDVVVIDGSREHVIDVRRAAGRKPAAGENIHLVTADGYLRANTTEPIRVIRREALA